MFLKVTDGLCQNIFSWMVVSKVIFLKLKEWIGDENVVSVEDTFPKIRFVMMKRKERMFLEWGTKSWHMQILELVYVIKRRD